MSTESSPKMFLARTSLPRVKSKASELSGYSVMGVIAETAAPKSLAFCVEALTRHLARRR
jgi:hypothetical protein